MSPHPEPHADHYRLGVVSFLNARPLVHSLDVDPSVTLRTAVPSALPALLEEGTVDCALVPVIDVVQPGRDWRVISDACIGCDGETLTVRIFSRVAPDQIRRLHVDGDSRTSVVLAQVLWRERYGRGLEIVPFNETDTVEECEAILLIGDKVVTRKLIGYDTQLDLGSQWKSLTGLPFVFAVWALDSRAPFAPVPLAAKLSAARDMGLRAAELIAEDVAPAMGWPVALAKRYLTTRLKYTLGPKQKQGITRFLQMAARHDLAPLAQEPVYAT
jgi:chorismate dehydratase